MADQSVSIEMKATTAAAVAEVGKLNAEIREATTAATVAGSAQQQLGKDVALTAAKVRDFQRIMALPVDGVAGARTITSAMRRAAGSAPCGAPRSESSATTSSCTKKGNLAPTSGDGPERHASEDGGGPSAAAQSDTSAERYSTRFPV